MSGPSDRKRSRSERTYRLLLRVYPTKFRETYGPQMEQMFRDLCRDESQNGFVGLARLWAHVVLDLIPSAIIERMHAGVMGIAVKDYKTAYRFAVGVALAAALLLIWISIGVGIIGADGDPANLMYAAVIAVGIIGAIFARFQPHGMARTLVAMALAQSLVATIALVLELGEPWSPPLEIVGLNGFFVALFLGSAWLFQNAERERAHS